MKLIAGWNRRIYVLCFLSLKRTYKLEVQTSTIQADLSYPSPRKPKQRLASDEVGVKYWGKAARRWYVGGQAWASPKSDTQQWTWPTTSTIYLQVNSNTLDRDQIMAVKMWRIFRKSAIILAANIFSRHIFIHHMIWSAFLIKRDVCLMYHNIIIPDTPTDIFSRNTRILVYRTFEPKLCLALDKCGSFQEFRNIYIRHNLYPPNLIKPSYFYHRLRYV